MPLCYIHTHNTWHCLFLGQPSWIPVCTYNKHGDANEYMWIINYTYTGRIHLLYEYGRTWVKTGRQEITRDCGLTGHVATKSVVSEPILPCYPIVVQASLWNVKKYEFCLYKVNSSCCKLGNKMDSVFINTSAWNSDSRILLQLFGKRQDFFIPFPPIKVAS